MFAVVSGLSRVTPCHTHRTVDVIAASTSALYSTVRSVVVSVCSFFNKGLAVRRPKHARMEYQTRPPTFTCDRAGALSSHLLLLHTVKLRAFRLAGTPRSPPKGGNAHSKLHRSRFLPSSALTIGMRFETC